MRWQFADESYGIREKKRNVIEHYFSNRRVDSSEKLVLCFDIGLTKKVHQCGFAGVCITHQRNAHNSASGLALCLSLLVDLLEVFLQQCDLVANDPPVGLDLPFPGTTARSSAPTLRLKVSPHPGKSRKQILIHRQLNLAAGLRGLGAEQEDVEDEKASVVNAHLFLS